MELSENERIILIKKKEEISKITTEIFDIYQDPDNRHDVLNKITQILNCLSVIASYAPRNERFTSLVRDVIDIDTLYDSEGSKSLTEFHIRKFCYFANYIVFEFKKDGINIRIPIEIKEAVLGKFQTG
jgi:hypothetical protein